MAQIIVPTVTLDAEWDADDPEIERIWLLMKELVRQIEIDDKVRDEADFMADRVYEKLNTARNSYQHIKKTDFAQLPTSNQKDIYEHLYAALWAAYKDCLQSILKTIGYNIGFMFVDDKNFDKQAGLFVTAHPSKAWLVDYARKIRANWHNDLANSRNAQHTGDFRKVKVDYNDPQTARELFEVVCYVIEGIFVLLVEERLSKGWLIVVVNDDETVFGRGERFAIKHYLEITHNNQSSEA